MIIKNVEFITSFSDANVYAKDSYPPEVCVVGRSNVGKSTFINMLTGRRIAKTSATPGRTRLINIFGVNGGQFNIIDLPGYGYAAAGKVEIDKWQSLAGGYFTASKSLKHVFLLADCRVSSPLDLQMAEYLYYYQIPFTLIATKSDKLSRSQLGVRLNETAAFFKLGIDNIIAISQSGMGREKVLQRMDLILSSTDSCSDENQQ